MPTERFLRLPKEKRETIRKAASEEFKRVPPEEASINKIIQAAEISRGSFYTYFEDKYDLLEWLMEDAIKSYWDFYLTELKKNGGDIWDVFDRILEETLRWSLEEGIIQIIRNMMESNAFSSMFPPRAQKCTAESAGRIYVEALYPYVSQETCPLTLEEFQDLMELHAMSLIFGIKTCLLEKKEIEEILPAYQRRNRLLRYGVCSKTV